MNLAGTIHTIRLEKKPVVVEPPPPPAEEPPPPPAEEPLEPPVEAPPEPTTADIDADLLKQRLATMLELREKKTIIGVEILRIAEFIFIGRFEDMPIHRGF